jgi:hypothetical protein
MLLLIIETLVEAYMLSPLWYHCRARLHVHEIVRGIHVGTITNVFHQKTFIKIQQQYHHKD